MDNAMFYELTVNERKNIVFPKPLRDRIFEGGEFDVVYIARGFDRNEVLISANVDAEDFRSADILCSVNMAWNGRITLPKEALDELNYNEGMHDRLRAIWYGYDAEWGPKNRLGLECYIRLINPAACLRDAKYNSFGTYDDVYNTLSTFDIETGEKFYLDDFKEAMCKYLKNEQNRREGCIENMFYVSYKELMPGTLLDNNERIVVPLSEIPCIYDDSGEKFAYAEPDGKWRETYGVNEDGTVMSGWLGHPDDPNREPLSGTGILKKKVRPWDENAAMVDHLDLGESGGVIVWYQDKAGKELLRCGADRNLKRKPHLYLVNGKVAEEERGGAMSRLRAGMWPAEPPILVMKEACVVKEIGVRKDD